jgi:hypothetical protein
MLVTLYLIGAALLIIGLVMTRQAKNPPAAYAGIALAVIGFATILLLAFSMLIRLWL